MTHARIFKLRVSNRFNEITLGRHRAAVAGGLDRNIRSCNRLIQLLTYQCRLDTLAAFDQAFMQDVFRRAYRYARMGRLGQSPPTR